MIRNRPCPRPQGRPFAPLPFAVLLLWLVANAASAACPEGLFLTRVAADLTKPVRLVAPVGDARLFIVQQHGLITVHDPDGTRRGDFLDIRSLTSDDGERGLLGLAFAPDYAQSGRCYVHYTNNAGDTRVVRYRVDPANPDALDPGSAEVLLAIDQPMSNHNGGPLEFAPDGTLIVGLGDGGGSGDPDNRAQDMGDPLGKLLRLDVSPATGYTVPADNPFAGTPGAELVWAYGLRNPWVFSFDRLSGDLYIADVGQNAWEEIDIVPAGTVGGRNFGWRVSEGAHCYNPSSGCDMSGHTLPAHEFAHGGDPFRCSISGGYVYRGENIPALQGAYFFSDFCSNQIWTLRWSSQQGVTEVNDCSAALTPPGGYAGVSGFGQDGLGEIYILDHGNGTVYRVDAEPTTPPPPPEDPTGFLEAAPNPFLGQIELSYEVPTDQAHITVEVHDLRGRLVRTLVDGPEPEGPGQAIWDGHDTSGRRLPAATYLCRIRHQGETIVRKVTLLD